MKGPILCFVGPPGVGKTSLGAASPCAGEEVLRLSLGGVHDEAEIRAIVAHTLELCGTDMQGLRRAGTNDPVFVLDEWIN